VDLALDCQSHSRCCCSNQSLVIQSGSGLQKRMLLMFVGSSHHPLGRMVRRQVSTRHRVEYSSSMAALRCTANAISLTINNPSRVRVDHRRAIIRSESGTIHIPSHAVVYTVHILFLTSYALHEVLYSP